MPFPIGPDPRFNHPETDFLIQDPFGLRKAVTPVFAFDMADGMLSDPRHGMSIGLGTSFYVTPFGHQLTAMHVTTDFRSNPDPKRNSLNRMVRGLASIRTPVLFMEPPVLENSCW